VQHWASCLHMPVLSSSTTGSSQWAVMLCGWEGNGLALHWPRVTDISGSPLMGSMPRKGR